MTRWWSTASIRVRMTTWYAAAICALLVVYASATFWAVRHEFFEQLEAQLHDDFESAEGLLAAAPAGRLAALKTRHEGDDPDENVVHGIDVWSSSGEPLYRSEASASLPPIVLLAATAGPRYESVTVGGHHWETLTGTSMLGGRAVVLRVARSEDHLRMQLWEILVVLVLGVPLVVGLAGIGGYAIARRALAPIDHLASEAHRITADRLHERLSVANEHDEIGRLAAVINGTFARLESSFDQLRRFTADASHELRTPLAVIRGIGEMNLGATRTPAEYTEAIGSMLEEVDRLTNLVDTLLRLSYADAGTVRLTPELVDLSELTRDVVLPLGILAEERHQRLDLALPDGVIVRVDRLVLREAVTNILDNAIKYGPEGSTIRVRVHAERDRAFLSIADQGAGIAPEHRERIFVRFFRIDEARARTSGGSGLGLAIAKWAVDVNRGQISVQNAPGGGALFQITLPLSAAAAQKTPQEHHLIGGHV